MNHMLPTFDWRAVSLADVLPSCLSALTGQPNRLSFPSARRVVVVVVDGLGAVALRERAGHARRLAAAAHETIVSSFPTTTASGLATLCTGVPPGVHGFVGYEVLDVARRRTVNLLSGWDNEAVPEEWQPLPTAFERAETLGCESFVVARPRFMGSGLTRAILRGAEFRAAESLEDRFEATRGILNRRSSSLTYLYIAELDTIAHNRGWRSREWTEALELVNAEISALERELGADDALIVTADHGIVDIASSGHVDFTATPELMDAVTLRFGEPRCLQLAVDENRESIETVAARWKDHEGERAWVATRSEAITAGWFGPVVEAAASSRMGDVIVLARDDVAYIASGDRAANMIGQHGSLSRAESEVPLARFGAFA